MKKTFKSILEQSEADFQQIVQLNESQDIEFTKAIKGNTTHNYKVYQEIIKQHPHVKTILEGIFTAPKYAINDIKVSKYSHNKSVVFYMNQSCSVESFFMKTLIKHDVSIQFPGNTDYNFSVSIDIK